MRFLKKKKERQKNKLSLSSPPFVTSPSSHLLLLPAPPYRRLLGHRVRVVRLQLHLVVAPLIQLGLDHEGPQEICRLGGVGQGLVDLLLLLAARREARPVLVEARAELFARGVESDGVSSEG